VNLPTPGERPTLVLERLPEAPHEPDSVGDAPLIVFDAFALDQRIFGWVRLSADRLTDLLNAHDEIALDNAQLERLGHGTLAWIDTVVIQPRQLIAVRAGGPHGDPAKRHRTRLHRLAVRAGSFRMGGDLHATPGVAPLAEIQVRPPMIPLTSAWLEYWQAGRRVSQWVGTILFNRDRADSIELIEKDLDIEH
jgi:hypothetical protein